MLRLKNETIKYIKINIRFFRHLHFTSTPNTTLNLLDRTWIWRKIKKRNT